MIIGKKLATAILGFSLVLSSALYADGSHNHTKTADTTTNNHMGDHMHEGKMMNHSNPDGMTDEQMKKMGH